MGNFRMVKDSVRHCPLPLLNLKDQTLIDFANNMWTRSVGIEIECEHEEDTLRNIPNVISNHDYSELRFRLTTGIEAMVALWDISVALHKYGKFNIDSGIHYHIDFNDQFDKLVKLRESYTSLNLTFPFMIKSIRHWNYKGFYNDMYFTNIKTAIRAHYEYKTIEYRIGEMTFDYTTLIKRILNCQNITNKLAIEASKKASPMSLN